MLKQQFNRDLSYRAVVYARMSSDKQNPRSPDQQLDEIKRTLRNQNLKWQIVKVYRDDGVSGRMIKRRKGFQQMLSDIKSGQLKVDLILVDTPERLGRSDDIQPIVITLRKKHGVLVVSADTRFDDPTSAQGIIYGAFQSLRATEENRIKAHQVKRGKRDIVLQKRWPGGKPPFGYRLKSVFDDPENPVIATGTVLEINPEEAAILRVLFLRAHETGDGQRKLAKWMNNNPDIPDKHKPFHGTSVERRLGNSMYKGVITWGIKSSDIVEDSWIRRLNSEDEHLVIPDFCEPIIGAEIWDEIQRVRQERRNRKKALKNAESSGEDEKLIQSLVPHVALKHLLCGLVRCGLCNSCMRPVTSGRKSKDGKIYSYFACARHLEGGCSNSKHIPEEWLNQIVTDALKASLFILE